MRFSFRRFLGINRFVLSPQEYKRVLLTGQLNILFMGVLASFTVMDMMWGYSYPIPFNIAGIAGSIIVYFVIRAGYFITARVILASFVNAITLYFTAALDRSMGLYQFSICINIGVMAAFGFENSRTAITIIALSTLLYLAAMFHPFPRIARIDLADPIYLDRNLLFGFVVATVSSVLVVYYLLRSNHVSESNLVKKERAISSKNQELLQVNAELDRFFYSVSHDLRAPLTSLQGLLALLETSQDPKQQREYTSLLRGRVDNLDHFVKTITSYAANARQAIRHEPVDLYALFREALENVRYSPQAERIHFNLDIAPDLEFQSDPARLQMIIGNLISNAVKYHDNTKVDRWIKITEKSTPDQLVIRIEDNGMGIRDEVMPRVFDMFYRGSQQSQGSGLGLYIVKEAVEKLNGTIQVQSVYGQGSVFTVTLPLNTKSLTTGQETA